MKKRFGILAVGLVCAASLAPGLAGAKEPFLAKFNAKYGTAGTSLDTCSVCHTSPPSLNPYGKAFKTAWKSGLKPGKAMGAIQAKDSDGDSFSNIVEIKARTFPGSKASHP
jgi:hypothetical protein